MNSKIKCVSLINIYGDKFGNSFGGNVWDKNQLCPTLKCGGAVAQNFVIVGDKDSESDKRR